MTIKYKVYGGKLVIRNWWKRKYTKTELPGFVRKLTGIRVFRARKSRVFNNKVFRGVARISSFNDLIARLRVWQLAGLMKSTVAGVQQGSVPIELLKDSSFLKLRSKLAFSRIKVLMFNACVTSGIFPYRVVGLGGGEARGLNLIRASFYKNWHGLLAERWRTLFFFGEVASSVSLIVGVMCGILVGLTFLVICVILTVLLYFWLFFYGQDVIMILSKGLENYVEVLQSQLLFTLENFFVVDSLLNFLGYTVKSLFIVGDLLQPLGDFHLRSLSIKMFFQDWEFFFSYTECLHVLEAEFVKPANRWLFSVGLVLIVLVWGYTAIIWRAYSMRKDNWGFFFTLSYYPIGIRRLESVEFFNQILCGKLLNITRNKNLFITSLLDNYKQLPGDESGGNSDALTRFCLEYYFSQTIGGVVGFLDLFPSHTSAHNAFFRARVKLKTYMLFNRIKLFLNKKLRLLRIRRGAFGRRRLKITLDRNALYRLKNKDYKLYQRIPTFLSPRFYLEVTLARWYKLFDWILNVSRLGDPAVFKMRHSFFNLALLKRDPWDSFDPSEGRDLPRVRMAVMPSPVNWYSRELNSVVAARSLINQFKPRSLFRFRFNSRSLLNDFSFWKPEINLTGRQLYFSKWDSFSVENQFDINVLGSTRFDGLERIASEDEEDEMHPEYVAENAESFFEDGLLHKDFELIFFDHEFDDLVVRGKLDPLFEELEDNPKLKTLLNNESIVYGAGQEADYTTKTTGKHYARHYSVEYGGLVNYKRRNYDVFYDDLADFMALNADSIVPYIVGIPAARPFLYWSRTLIGGSYGAFEKSERVRLGRVFYNFWLTAVDFLTPSYYKSWIYTTCLTLVSAVVWFIASNVSVLWFSSLFLPKLWDIVDITLLFVFIILGQLCCCALLVLLLNQFLRFNIMRQVNLTLLTNYFTLALFGVWYHFTLFCSEARPFQLGWLFKLPSISSIDISKVGGGAATWGCTKINMHPRQAIFDRALTTPVLRFFISAYIAFCAFGNSWGSYDSKVAGKLAGYDVQGINGLSMPFNYRSAGLSGARVGQLIFEFNNGFAVSRARYIYNSRKNYFLGFMSEVNNYNLSLLLYDFQISFSKKSEFSDSLSSRNDINFTYGLLFQESFREQTKFKSTSKVNSFIRGRVGDRARYTWIAGVLRDAISSDRSSTWSFFLSDMLFASLSSPITLFANDSSLLNYSDGELYSSSKLNLSGRQGLSEDMETGYLTGLNSRKRSKHLRFFESRVPQTSYSIYASAYENFLRLFMSKEALRNVYYFRSRDCEVSTELWSYTAKVGFTDFSVPLHKL